MERVNVNGLAAVDAPARRSKRAPRKDTQGSGRADRIRLVMTVTLGIGIPCLSLAMSKLAGTLAANGHLSLAAFSFALMVAVLGVSLNHLAWAIGNITRSGWRSSWSLAIALDLSLVLCELVHVYAPALGMDWVRYSVMAYVAVSSMALNVWAFLLHD